MDGFPKNFYAASIACLFSVWFTTAQTALAESGNFSLSYSGRLTQADGAPVAGPVDVTVKFWSAATAGNPLTTPIELPSTALNEGMFTLSLDLNPPQVSAVFGQGTDPVFIEITAAGKTYPRQQYSYVPYALRVPVDNKTVAFDADGKLGLALTSQPSANQFLTKDSSGRLAWGSPAVTTLQGQNIASTAPTSGQVLTYFGGQWVPQTFAVASAAGGTVTNVTGTAPVSVTTGTTTPLISIAQASGSVDGYLSSADWSAFNAKQNALGFVPVNKSGDTMTGALSAPVISQPATSAPAASGTGEGRIYFDSALNRFQVSQNGSAYAPLTNNATVSRVDVGAGLTGGPITTSGTVSLANTTVTAGTYMRANITVDAQGRLTAAQSASAIVDADIATAAGIAQSKIQGLVSELSSKEPALPSGGTATQYLDGNKTWQTLSTTEVAEGTNEYFTQARAKSALSASAPITYNFTSGTIGISPASGNSNGYLSSSDWSTFNGKQNALGFAPLNKTGDTMSGALNMDGSDVKSVGNIGMAASKTLLLSNHATDPTGLTAADKGKTWFNSQTNQVKYWDGSNAQALGVSGAGLTNLNGLTGSTQTFAMGASGNSPMFNSTGTIHTLNIPMASVIGVTAGLVSNSDYAAFNNKVSGVTGGTGISVVTSGGTATVSLSSVGTAGTYTKVTTNVQGQVIGASTLSASDIPGLDANKITSGVLGVSNGGTGVNSTATYPTSGVIVTRDATETITNKTLSAAAINGASSISGSTTIDTTGTVNAGATTIAGNVTIIGNSATANKLLLNDKGSANSVALKAPDTLASSLTLELPSNNGSSGQVLSTNGSGTLSWVSAAVGSVTNVTGTAPIAVATGTSTPVISMSQANGTTNGYLTSSDWNTFNGKQSAGSYLTGLTGDITATGPGSAAATLAAVAIAGTSTKVTYDVKGRVTSGTSLMAADIPPISAALITSGTLAVANGGTGVSTTPSNGQLLIGNGANYALGNLTAGTGINISNSAGAITVSATADASTKVSKTGDTMSGALNLPANGLVAGTNQLVLANGNVGIGTTVPVGQLNIVASGAASAINIGNATTNHELLTIGTSGDSGSTSYSYLTAANTNVAYNALALQPYGGNVGIGTTSPNYPLQVYRAGNSYISLDTNSGGSTNLLLNSDTYSSVVAATKLGISTSGAERVRIESNGNVGIGTTAPTQALDVNGTIRAAHVSITGSSCGWSGWACSPTCAAGYYQAGTMMGAANNCNGTGPNVQIYCCSF